MTSEQFDNWNKNLDKLIILMMILVISNERKKEKNKPQERTDEHLS